MSRELLTLRNIGVNSLRLIIPNEYVEEFGLEAGDKVQWVPDANGVRLRFIKAKEYDKLVKEL